MACVHHLRAHRVSPASPSRQCPPEAPPHLAPARQLRLDHLVGSLEAGKAADLIVLRDNLFEIPPHRIAATPIDMTMVNGRFTHGGPPEDTATDIRGSARSDSARSKTTPKAQ